MYKDNQSQVPLDGYSIELQAKAKLLQHKDGVKFVLKVAEKEGTETMIHLEAENKEKTQSWIKSLNMAIAGEKKQTEVGTKSAPKSNSQEEELYDDLDEEDWLKENATTEGLGCYDDSFSDEEPAKPPPSSMRKPPTLEFNPGKPSLQSQPSEDSDIMYDELEEEKPPPPTKPKPRGVPPQQRQESSNKVVIEDDMYDEIEEVKPLKPVMPKPRCLPPQQRQEPSNKVVIEDDMYDEIEEVKPPPPAMPKPRSVPPRQRKESSDKEPSRFKSQPPSKPKPDLGLGAKPRPNTAGPAGPRGVSALGSRCNIISILHCQVSQAWLGCALLSIRKLTTTLCQAYTCLKNSDFCWFISIYMTISPVNTAALQIRQVCARAGAIAPEPAQPGIALSAKCVLRVKLIFTYPGGVPARPHGID